MHSITNQIEIYRWYSVELSPAKNLVCELQLLAHLSKVASLFSGLNYFQTASIAVTHISMVSIKITYSITNDKIQSGPKTDCFQKFVTPVYVDKENRSIYQTVCSKTGKIICHRFILCTVSV